MNEPTPLEFLRSIYMDEEIPLPTRIKAATEAAQYVHPKLAAIATYAADGDFAARLDAAIARSGRGPKLIEGIAVRPQGPSPEEVSASAMGQGFAPLRRRF